MLQKNIAPHKTHAYGFTIVELLIVIVIIGILATLATATYNGIQQRSLNNARYQEAKQWQRIIGLYLDQYGDPPSAYYQSCLGEGFPNTQGDSRGDCWDLDGSVTASENPTLNAEWRKVAATLPNSTRTSITGADGIKRMGPVLINYYSPIIYVSYWIETTSGQCPEGIRNWNDSNTVQCWISIPRN